MTDDPNVFSYALGPLINGRRLPPILRIRLGEKAFMIENKAAAGWNTIAMATTAQEAFDAMHQCNANALAQKKMTIWPQPTIRRAA